MVVVTSTNRLGGVDPKMSGGWAAVCWQLVYTQMFNYEQSTSRKFQRGLFLRGVFGIILHVLFVFLCISHHMVCHGERWPILEHCWLALWSQPCLNFLGWLAFCQHLKDIFVLRHAILEENVGMKNNIYSCGSAVTKLVCRQRSGTQQQREYKR